MSPIAIIYAISVAASIITAIIIVQVARRNAQARLQAEKARNEQLHQEESPGPAVRDERAAIQDGIIQEITKIVGASRAEEVARRVSDVLGPEIEKKVTSTAQELSRKYESIIQEKTQNEEVAWKKYGKILGEKQETDAVIRSIAEGLVVVDAQGKVVMMNPAAEKLLGVSRKEKLGTPITEGLKEEQLLSFTKTTNEGKNKEIELVSQEAETKKILRASSAVIENENGQTVGMVSVLSDITKQKELDQMKSNLVANVSHELRTPLVAIDKSISLILTRTTGPLTDNQEQFLTIAQRNLKRLSLLINDLLDLSKLEAGKMELHPQMSSLEKAINESIDGLMTWSGAKDITVKRKIEPGMPDILIDSNRIIQVLNNLIGNAIKFTPKGGIITVDAHLEANGSKIQVSVHDTGVGIEQNNLAKVFDKFFQVGERISTDISGTGIGLSIAKEFVELHGGKIWVESEKGQGAKFIFTLQAGQGSK